MFDLNPLAQANAWWQHLVMILGAGIIGYIIGYRKSKRTVAQLNGELGVLDGELEDYRQVPAEVSTVVVAEATNPVVDLASSPVGVAAKPDNLKKIDGIGPKIEQLLNKEGIFTFRQLSNTTSENILSVLRAAGPRFQMHDPGTWPQQAALAADEKWDELTTLQFMLNKGRSA